MCAAFDGAAAWRFDLPMTFVVTRMTNRSDWPALRAIREEVFIVEQRCPPEEEWDAFDDDSIHLVGRLDGEVVATARWRPVEHAGRTMAKLERFAIRAAHRGGGLGRALVAAAIDDARAAGHDAFVLHAQAHLERFYQSFGFRTEGAPFDEAGIPHVLMLRRATRQAGQ